MIACCCYFLVIRRPASYQSSNFSRDNKGHRQEASKLIIAFPFLASFMRTQSAHQLSPSAGCLTQALRYRYHKESATSKAPKSGVRG